LTSSLARRILRTMPETYKTGDAVTVECDGRIVEGEVIRASPNSVSLMLGFEAILAGHVGTIPVFRGDDGIYRSIVNEAVVRIVARNVK
jgi:hypothetical protein